jgi:hypothetical protein
MIHSDFLDIDFRKQRDPKKSLVSTDDLTIHKHEVLLPPELIKGKTILDLGCFHSATGDWCLRNGSASYTGVEISQEFSDIARGLMTKHHPGGNWRIHTAGFDQFFDADKTKFDIVFAWGVLHHTLNHVWFLNELSQRADHVIIGARTPRVMWRDTSVDSEFLKKLEYDIAYTEYHNGEMSLMYGPEFGVKCVAANSSLAAVKMIMATNGFETDLDAYEHFKQYQPTSFGMFAGWDQPGFYIINFHKNSDKKLSTYEKMHYDTDLIVRFQ